jgi:hypothetical protein
VHTIGSVVPAVMGVQSPAVQPTSVLPSLPAVTGGDSVHSPYCKVPVMGLLLPHGVVQPFEILFSRDDLHVIVNLTAS